MSALGDPRERLAEVEEFFLRSGMPHLAADYDPREDTLTRLRPALAVLFAVGLAVVLRPDWPGGSGCRPCWWGSPSRRGCWWG